jgi:abortive infection bacteriophage resistance protein
MRYSKQATTVDDQLRLMASRGLVIKDETRLQRELLTIGYYRLSGYWLHFEEPATNGQTRSKRFKSGTRHEEVIDLYIFDRKLRLRIMEAIERLEVAVRASWTYRLSLASGSHAHLDSTNFRDRAKHADRLQRLTDAVGKSSEQFIRHYTGKYTNPKEPPIWAVTEVLTIGELSRWYDLTASRQVRADIAADLGISSTQDLSSILQVLSFVRNVCAHHGRLWNRHTTKRLPVFREVGRELVMDKKRPGTSQNSLYNVIVACLHMLRVQSPDTTYAARLANLLLDASTARQRMAMGFPQDWQTRPIWGLTQKAQTP